MNLFSKALVVIALITTSNHLLAQDQIIQQKNHQDHTFKMYDYEFSGDINTIQQESLRNEISQMHFVTEAKIYFKSEKGRGMVRVLTDEYYTDKNSDFEFDIYTLKMLISKFNLTPIEYRSEIITK